MPKLLYARPPNDPAEEHKFRKHSGRGGWLKAYRRSDGGGSFDVRHWQDRPLPMRKR
jgi:hypothetical protein